MDGQHEHISNPNFGAYDNKMFWTYVTNEFDTLGKDAFGIEASRILAENEEVNHGE